MSTAAQSPARRVDMGFIRARIGSLLAIVPLGVWTVVHLWNNLSAFKGPAEWQRDVTEYDHPLAFFASSVVVLLPLVLHTIWGIGRLVTVRPNNVRYKYFSNVRYTIQRLSAIGLLLFLGAHIWLAMLRPRITTNKPEPFADIAHEMHHHLPTLLVYVLGVLGVAYHLANGLHTFMMGWGIVTSRQALKKLEIIVWLAFIGLLGMGWAVVYALWEAGR